MESQSFNGNENLEIHNEQKEAVDTLQEISTFFEDNFFETTEFQTSYEAFSQEQKVFIENSFYQLHEKYTDDLINVVLETDGLPYDNDSFNKFQEKITELLQRHGLQSFQKVGGEEQIISNLETKESNLKTKESNLETKESNLETKESNVISNEIKEKEISALSEKIRNNYSQVEIDGVLQDVQLRDTQGNLLNIDNLYQNIEGEGVERDIKFIELYGAKLLEYIAQNGSKEQFESLYRDLENVQLQYGIVIEGFDAMSTWNEKSIDTPNSIPTEENAIKYGLDTSQFHISRVEGDSLIYGDQKIDFGENPPVKYIKNGNFELKSGELDYKVDKQLRSDIFVLEHKIPQIDERISGLESQKLQSMDYSVNMQKVTNFNQETLDFLFEQTLKDENSPLKNEIKNAIEAVGGDNNSQNTEKLKSLLIENSKKKENEINILLTELNSQKHLAELKLDTMKDKLDAMRDAFKQKVLENDEKVRDVLQFVNQIGLDLINPQARLDQLFTELQQNSLKVPGLSLDPKKIDLANGRFGESDMEQSTDKWKENLIKFFNKMVSGNTDEPNNPKDFISVGGKTINPTKMKESLENAGVLNDMGEAQIDTIRKNLQSTTKSEKSTNFQEK